MSALSCDSSRSWQPQEERFRRRQPMSKYPFIERFSITV